MNNVLNVKFTTPPGGGVGLVSNLSGASNYEDL